MLSMNTLAVAAAATSPPSVTRRGTKSRMPPSISTAPVKMLYGTEYPMNDQSSLIGEDSP